MKNTTNYHTHSVFCDGNNSVQEMAKKAYDLGITTLGFSSHTAFPFASFWHMDVRNYDEYFHDIQELKKEYEGRMEILAGVEAEYLPPISYCDVKTYDFYKPDFIIGSVHYLVVQDKAANGCFTVDGPAQEFYKGIQMYFNGDGKKAIQAYFSTQREMIQNCSFDIIGHIDLVRKRNAELKIFSETDTWYRNEIKETAKIVGKTDKIVEINTGGMTRANMDSPYPSPDFLKLLHAEGVPVTINSDCHDANSIMEHFDSAIKVAREAGYTATHHLSKGKWHTSDIV